jgi:hypothetical protein
MHFDVVARHKTAVPAIHCTRRRNGAETIGINLTHGLAVNLKILGIILHYAQSVDPYVPFS